MSAVTQQLNQPWFVAVWPGVLPESIELRVSGNLLLIHGRRETVQISQTARSVCVERAQGEFSRQFKPEHPVDATRLETQFENGLYRAWLPKLAVPPPGAVVHWWSPSGPLSPVFGGEG